VLDNCVSLLLYICVRDFMDDNSVVLSTGLFEMIVGVLTTCHTQNT